MHQEEKHHGRRIVLGGSAAVVSTLLLLDANRTILKELWTLAEGFFQDAGYEYERRASYVSAEQVFRRLQKHGLHPHIRTYGGDRTLLVIGEPPGNHREEYPQFFDAVMRDIDFDRLFMEFAYADTIPVSDITNREKIQPREDPYFSRQDDVMLLLTGRKVPASSLDFHGYEKLSHKLVINGLDDRVLCRDAMNLTKLEQLLLYLDPEKTNDQELRAYASQIQKEVSGRWKFIDESSAAPFSYYDLVARVCDALLIARIAMRNQYFAQIINYRLEQHEVGAMIVSDAHLDPQRIIRREQEKVPGLNLDPTKYGTLHDYLEAAKIDTVYLPFSEVKRMVG